MRRILQPRMFENKGARLPSAGFYPWGGGVHPFLAERRDTSRFYYRTVSLGLDPTIDAVRDASGGMVAASNERDSRVALRLNKRFFRSSPSRSRPFVFFSPSPLSGYPKIFLKRSLAVGFTFFGTLITCSPLHLWLVDPGSRYVTWFYQARYAPVVTAIVSSFLFLPGFLKGGHRAISGRLRPKFIAPSLPPGFSKRWSPR